MEYNLEELLARFDQRTLDSPLSDVVGNVDKVYIHEWVIMNSETLKSYIKETCTLFISTSIAGKDIKYNRIRKVIFIDIKSYTINELCVVYNFVNYGPR